MREGIVDMPGQHSVDMRRSAAIEGVCATPSVDRNPRMAWFTQWMMTNQYAPGVFATFAELLQHVVKVGEVYDAISPVETTLQAPRRVDCRNPDQTFTQFDDTPDTIELGHMPPIESERGRQPPVKMVRKMQAGRVVVAWCNDTADTQSAQPGARGEKLPLPAILGDISRHNQRIGTNLIDVFANRIECVTVDRAKMNVRHMDELDCFWRS
jgi:hypothetical protein